MRLKAILPILLAAAAVLAFAFYSRPPHPIAPASAPSPAATPAPATITAVAPPPLPAQAAPPAASSANAAALRAATRQEYIKTRSDELMTLAMQDDAASHQQIVAELNNTEPAIRKAALEALKQANDRSVIPQMQEIADQTADPDQKQAIEDAIDFIQLPSPVEYLKAREADTAASTP